MPSGDSKRKTVKQFRFSRFNSGEKDIETASLLVQRAQGMLLSLRDAIASDGVNAERTHESIHALYMMVRPMLIPVTQTHLDQVSETTLATCRKFGNAASDDLNDLGNTQRFDLVRRALSSFMAEVMEYRQIYGLGYPSEAPLNAGKNFTNQMVPKR